MPAIAVVRDDHSAPFFDALGQGRLLLRRDPRSGRWHRPTAVTAPDGGALEWSAARGTGTVESWAVVHSRDDEPVLVGIVELDEGPWLRTRLVDLAPEALTDGLPVRLVPRVLSGPDPSGAPAEPVPCFGPA
jgi:uncharacterized protein